MVTVMGAFKRLILKTDAILERVEALFITLCSLALIGMFGLIFIEILSRKLLKTSIHISVEFSEYGLALIGLLALAAVTRRKEHLQVQVLVDRLSKSVRKVLDFVFSLLLFFIYNLFLTYLCYALFSGSISLGTRSQTVMHTPLWIPQIVVFIGLLAADFRLLNDLFKTALGLDEEAGPATRIGG